MSTEDWRLQGQDRYLRGAKLRWSAYAPSRPGNDHDHCEFCGRKFSASPADRNVGYSTQDGYRWICKECFEDFKCSFGWQVVS